MKKPTAIQWALSLEDDKTLLQKRQRFWGTQHMVVGLPVIYTSIAQKLLEDRVGGRSGTRRRTCKDARDIS